MAPLEHLFKLFYHKHDTDTTVCVEDKEIACRAVYGTMLLRVNNSKVIVLAQTIAQQI